MAVVFVIAASQAAAHRAAETGMGHASQAAAEAQLAKHPPCKASAYCIWAIELSAPVLRRDHTIPAMAKSAAVAMSFAFMFACIGVGSLI